MTNSAHQSHSSHFKCSEHGPLWPVAAVLDGTGGEDVLSLGQHCPAGTPRTKHRAGHTVSGRRMAHGAGGLGRKGRPGKVRTWRPMNMAWAASRRKGREPGTVETIRSWNF